MVGWAHTGTCWRRSRGGEARPPTLGLQGVQPGACRGLPWIPALPVLVPLPVPPWSLPTVMSVPFSLAVMG